MTPRPKQQFAAITWESRWNSSTAQCAGLSQSGSRVMLVTAMGYVHLDLTNTEDVEAYCTQMELAINMLRKTKREYDHAMGVQS